MRLRRWTPALAIAQAKRPTSEHPSIQAAREGRASLRADNRSGLPAGGSATQPWSRRGTAEHETSAKSTRFRFQAQPGPAFFPGPNCVGRFFAPYGVAVAVGTEARVDGLLLVLAPLRTLDRYSASHPIAVYALTVAEEELSGIRFLGRDLGAGRRLTSTTPRPRRERRVRG
jgi:hypothetical protein